MGTLFIGFFETIHTFESAMVLYVNHFLAKHRLNAHVCVYVKDEGNNFSTMTFTLIFIVSCEILGLLRPFVGACWDHVMSKCC